MTTTLEDKAIHRKIVNSLFVAVGVTLFLFFIDEGYYNFNWMVDAGNWLAFFLYVVLLFTGQLLLIRLLFRHNFSRLGATVQHTGGVILGIALAFYLFS